MIETFKRLMNSLQLVYFHNSLIRMESHYISFFPCMPFSVLTKRDDEKKKEKKRLRGWIYIYNYNYTAFFFRFNYSDLRCPFSPNAPSTLSPPTLSRFKCRHTLSLLLGQKQCIRNRLYIKKYSNLGLYMCFGFGFLPEC